MKAIVCKIIIHKSRGVVSLVEQDTIEYVTWPIEFLRKNQVFYLPFMQHFSTDVKYLKKNYTFFAHENMKNFCY